MTHCRKVLASEPDDLSSKPGSTREKRKTDSSRHPLLVIRQGDCNLSTPTLTNKYRNT